MSIEEFEQVYNQVAKEREANTQPLNTSELDNETAINMGILQPEQEVQTQPEATEQSTITDAQGIERDPNTGERVYQKLSLKETAKDVGISLAGEFNRVLAPKEGSKLANFLGYSEEDLNYGFDKYQPKTHLAENVKNLYKYGMSTLAWSAAIAATGGGAAEAGVAANLPKLKAAGDFIKNLGLGSNVFKASGKGLLQKAGAWFGNNLIGGAPAGILTEIQQREYGEGHLADMLPESKYLAFLQTQPDDTVFEDRLKGVIEEVSLGFFINAGFSGIAASVKPLLAKMFKSQNQLVHAETEEAAQQAINDIAQSQIDLQRFATTADRIKVVDDLMKQADETGAELSQLIIDNVPAVHREEAMQMAKLKTAGEEIFPHADGTWDISINNWEDAYKVSPEEYAKQMKALDDGGATAINHQDAAVKETWTNRGLIGEGKDELIDASTGKANTKAINRVIDHYKDKWQLKNKIKVEFIQGLTNKGKKVEALTSSTKDKKTINIKIDPTTPNPYAVLRSELEHARDIAKGEVPKNAMVKDSGTHFARYTGDNEAEVAPAYVHKKATGKYKYQNLKELEDYTLAETPNTAFGETLDEEPYMMVTLHNKEGEQVAHLNYSEREDGSLYINWRVNEGVEKAAARKLVAKLIQLHPDRIIDWEATTGASRSSYQHFVKEYPDLVDRVIYTDSLDLNNTSRYNPEKGAIENGQGNTLHQQPTGLGGLNGEQREAGLRSSSDALKVQSKSERDGLTGGMSGEIRNFQGNVAGKESTNIESGRGTNEEAPQLDNLHPLATAQSTDEIVNGISNGEIKIETFEELETLVDKVVETDPKIAGKTFKEIAKEADEYFTKEIMENIEDCPAIQEAFLQGDAEKVLQIGRKQLAATRAIAMLRDKLTDNLDQAYDIQKTMDYLSKYVDAVRSGSGALLNLQKLINKSEKVFANSSASDLAKLGIVEVADILEKVVDDIGLAFTRGQKLTAEDYKQSIIEALNKDYPEFVGTIAKDDITWGIFNKQVEKSYKANAKFNKREFVADVAKALETENTAEKTLAVKLCDKIENIPKVLANWTNKTAGYMVNNVLGPVTSMINIVGGTTMSLHSANSRIIGGLLTKNGNITKAGIRQYQGYLEAFSDSLRLAKQAFKKGDGLLTTTKKYVDGVLQYNMEEFNPKSFQDWLSVIPRFMMASDEFMSQLNYRSIVRSKAIEQTERMLNGKQVSDEEFAQLMADRFKAIAFNDEGRPLDIDAFAEAKDILFQTPLNRKIFDYKHNESVQIGEQSWISSFGQGIQFLTEKFPPLRLFNFFIKTPFNIAEKGQDMTLIGQLSPRVMRQLTSQNPEIKAKAMGNIAITTTLSLGAFLAAVNGFITGSEPPDRKQAAALRKAGWQPNSFYIGGKFISYRGLAPFDSLLAMSADSAAIMSGLTDKDTETKMSLEDASMRFMAAWINDFFDQSGYRGNTEKMLDLLDPTTDSRTKSRILGTMGRGLVPFSSTISNVTSLGKHEEKQAKTAWDYMFKGIVPKQMDFKRDVFGNRSDMYGLLITKMSDNDFEMPEYQEIARLAESGWSPTAISEYVSESNFSFKEFKDPETGRSAYDFMLEELSKTDIREDIRALVTSPEYQALPTGLGKQWQSSDQDTKIKMISEIFKEYNDIAKEEILNSDIPFVNDKGETLEEAKHTLDTEMEQTVLDALTKTF